PRIGIAYQILPKTVLRVGFGMHSCAPVRAAALVFLAAEEHAEAHTEYGLWQDLISDSNARTEIVLVPGYQRARHLAARHFDRRERRREVRRQRQILIPALGDIQGKSLQIEIGLAAEPLVDRRIQLIPQTQI